MSRMRKCLSVWLVASMLATPALVASLLGLAGCVAGERDGSLRLRRPVALHLVDGGKVLLVANRDSGTIAVLDTASTTVISETRIARKLSDMTAMPGSILATDED